ncbi:xanthine dehydrogenase family protein molybdopterin-binding subunit [Telluria mixta]|uniref:Xanthine dehydrogenase family protein molybdopterin-binding subunit n=1 Tax=Telluria mixta TaxID=34071 RepID=A0ABT2BUM1_9BURK|nr:xanthine dehydrogenase family protein molybdopterin-binding subunit [Telluria mixta]MCS0628823.1 xanthine dehydrogenase family protein molybdopterin-binding subunit [Telluria mixta]WEM97278.1 xanthine dehydrogenase family protein molybdopterin-binding subunit [Telluria mixta]
MRIERSNQVALTRRGFLKSTGGLVLGFVIPVQGRAATPAPASPNAFLHIAPDDTVTVLVDRLEFGQGVHTALPMLVAEELDADWSRVRAELAPAGDAYKDPLFGIQMTGSSISVAHSFTHYREIGARARAMLVAAAAERWQVAPDACTTAAGVVIGPGGRKARYGALADAAMKQPVPATVKLKDAKDFRHIGKPTGRLDARAKSSGKQQFGIDFTLPGMKVAVVARPPVFGGRVRSLDAGKARAIKGVVDVVEVAVGSGGRGVAVIADGYWPASQGRDALVIDWDTGAVDKVDSERQLRDYRTRAATPALATTSISAVYEFPYLAHAPMEPINCVVDLHADRCSVWAGVQFQTFDQTAVAAAAGLKLTQVTLHTMMSGGGFGRRGVTTSDDLVEAVNVARAYGRGPVKVIWSREDDIKGGYYRPAHVHKVDIGLDGKGDVVAWNHVIVGQAISAGTPFESVLIKNGVDSTTTEGILDAYALPVKLSVHHPKANVPVLWWRGSASNHTAFVMETLVDEVAHAAGADPVEYRRKLLGDKRPRHLAALDLAVQKSGYGKKPLGEGRAWGVAVHGMSGSVVAYVVEASVEKDVPRLHKVTAGVHCNLAVNPLTIEAQVQGAVLAALGTTLPGAAITFKDGVVEQRNFSDYTVARMPDMPHVGVFIVPSADPPTGMGEPGLPPLAPAFANAIFQLTGKRLRKLPFDLG